MDLAGWLCWLWFALGLGLLFVDALCCDGLIVLFTCAGILDDFVTIWPVIRIDLV